jgi:CubicO group peptidase (beta-lactamase class C family)
MVSGKPTFGSSAPEDKKINALLKTFVDRHALAGAVTLVASKDKIHCLQAIGYADIGKKRAMQIDDLFWIASQNKPITGTALMLLVDEGKVNVEDPVEKYLPEFKNQMLIVEQDEEHVLLRKPDHPIKVREVLSHTSGLAFSTPMETPTLDAMPLRDTVRSHAMMPLQYPPGTKYQYSNGGTNTAGRIIEVVSGMSYEDFMSKRLFDPLGMTDTTFWPSEAQCQRLAKSYKPTEDKTNMVETPIGQMKYPLWDRATRYPFPAGGLFSTAQDCARFCMMILNGGVFEGKRYISEASIKQMSSRQTAESIKESYGFGWSVGEGNFGHGGAHSTNMNIDTKRGIITVYLVQHAGFPLDGDKSHAAFKQLAEETYAR